MLRSYHKDDFKNIRLRLQKFLVIQSIIQIQIQIKNTLLIPRGGIVFVPDASCKVKIQI